jgi:hypothetical protein
MHSGLRMDFADGLHVVFRELNQLPQSMSLVLRPDFTDQLTVMLAVILPSSSLFGTTIVPR